MTHTPIRLADLESNADTRIAFSAALATSSYAVLSLGEEGDTLHASLATIGSKLERFHGCSPRFHECAGSNVSAWSRRVFMHFEHDAGHRINAILRLCCFSQRMLTWLAF